MTQSDIYLGLNVFLSLFNLHLSVDELGVVSLGILFGSLLSGIRILSDFLVDLQIKLLN